MLLKSLLIIILYNLVLIGVLPVKTILAFGLFSKKFSMHFMTVAIILFIS